MEVCEAVVHACVVFIISVSTRDSDTVEHFKYEYNRHNKVSP